MRNNTQSINNLRGLEHNKLINAKVTLELIRVQNAKNEGEKLSLRV